MRELNNWIEKNILFGKRPYFLIAALIFIVYFPALFFNFTYLDDNNLILEHAGFLSHFLNIFESFRQDVFLSYADAYYRPILNVSLIFDAQFSQSSPFVFHLTNILIHLLATISLFVLFQKFKYQKNLALFFSLVFAVHPILVQAVAWIPGRNDSLLMLFISFSFIYFLKFLEEKNGKNLTIYLIFSALAIFTKESAIFLLLVQASYLCLVRKEKIITKNNFKLALGLSAIMGMFFVLRQVAFQNPIAMPFSNLLKSVVINFPATLQLIGKIVFPFNLSVLPIIQDTTFIFGIIAVIFLGMAIYFSQEKRWNYLIFGGIWFFVFLLPSFIRPNTEIVADFIEHRIYLPIIGFFIIILEIDWIKKINFKKKIPLFVSVGIILFFIVLTVSHLPNFKDRMAFWRNARENSPHSPLAHRNLGAMYFLDGKMNEAEEEFKESLKLNPKEQMAHNNLGLIYMNRGNLEEAEKEYDKELENNPTYDNAYLNKGILYYKLGKFYEAIDAWKMALKINPLQYQSVHNIFAYYYQNKNIEEATFWAKEAQSWGMPLLPEMERILNPFSSVTLPNAK